MAASSALKFCKTIALLALAFPAPAVANPEIPQEWCDFSDRYFQETGITLATDLTHLMHGPGESDNCDDCERSAEIRRGNVYVSLLPASQRFDYSSLLAATQVHSILFEEFTPYFLEFIPSGELDLSQGESLAFVFVDEANVQSDLEAFRSIEGANDVVMQVAHGESTCSIIDVLDGAQREHVLAFLSPELAEHPDEFEGCVGAAVYSSIGIEGLPYQFDPSSDDNWRNARFLEVVGEGGYEQREAIATAILYSGLIENGAAPSTTYETINDLLARNCE